MLVTNNPIYNLDNYKDVIPIISGKVYDKKFNTLNLDDFSYFDHGNCANIYRKDDILFKKYNCDCKYKNYIPKKTFDILKSINVPNFVELLDYYYNSKTIINYFLPIDSYTMKLVDDERITLSDASKEYLKDTLERLDETIKVLSDNKVFIFDAVMKNIIFSKNGVTIIDPDLFIISNFSTEKKAYIHNANQIMLYISRTITKELGKKEIYNNFSYFRYNSDLGLVNSVMKDIKEDTIRKTLKLTQN